MAAPCDIHPAELSLVARNRTDDQSFCETARFRDDDIAGWATSRGGDEPLETISPHNRTRQARETSNSHRELDVALSCCGSRTVC